MESTEEYNKRQKSSAPNNGDKVTTNKEEPLFGDAIVETIYDGDSIVFFQYKITGILELLLHTPENNTNT